MVINVRFSFIITDGASWVYLDVFKETVECTQVWGSAQMEQSVPSSKIVDMEFLELVDVA